MSNQRGNKKTGRSRSQETMDSGSLTLDPDVEHLNDMESETVTLQEKDPHRIKNLTNKLRTMASQSASKAKLAARSASNFRRAFSFNSTNHNPQNTGSIASIDEHLHDNIDMESVGSKRLNFKIKSRVGMSNNEGFKGRFSALKGLNLRGSLSNNMNLKRVASKIFRTGANSNSPEAIPSVIDLHSSTGIGSDFDNDPDAKEIYDELKRFGAADMLQDAVEIITKMKKKPENHRVIALGMKFLTPIALQEPLGLAMAGLIEVLVRAIDVFPRNAKINEFACLLLWNLATEDTNKQLMFEAGVPERVVKVLSDFRLQKAGSAPLMKNPTLINSKKTSTQKTGLATIQSKSSKSLRTSEHIPDSALSRLGSKVSMIASPRAMRPKKKTRAATKALVELSPSHLESQEAEIAKNRKTVLHMACGAVKLLATDEDCKKALADLKGIDLIVSTFMYFCSTAPNDPGPQETCISCIQNFCHGKHLSRYCDLVFRRKGPELVVRTMLKFSENSDIQMTGCAALWNMSLAVKRTRLPSRLIDPETLNNGAQEAAEGNSQVVLDTKTRRKELAVIGAASRTIAALINFKQNDLIAERAMAALFTIVQDDPEILAIVRNTAHNRSIDLSVINIYDVIFDAYSIHEEQNHYIRKVGEKLLHVFDCEDSEQTNRARIKKMNGIPLTSEDILPEEEAEQDPLYDPNNPFADLDSESGGEIQELTDAEDV